MIVPLRRNLWLGACLLLTAAGCTAARPLCVMTFNIRYGTAKDGENRWENRRGFVFETIVPHGRCDTRRALCSPAHGARQPRLSPLTIANKRDTGGKGHAQALSRSGVRRYAVRAARSATRRDNQRFNVAPARFRRKRRI